ncbi:hypothetical protein BGP89_10740 [Luteimonas sp. JM171]|uniref:hypothetical protein n=1 Tax=Luteimonas sp. JM171 TaxID=1896164 RepID=UPI0008584979|nr:hypothetical protein [Luteimonas sp. JM171]AOH36767.1 hypothetical protein BGP89_10740 [Luteimonas sp. JM171]
MFCASDITFGVNWEFSRRRVGDYLAGYLRQPSAIRLARAVAASSSFPPLFGPVRFPAGPEDFTHGKYRGDDGGDNQAGSRGAGYLETFVSETIGRIRTDLDRFLPREFEVLVNHGYFMCGHGLDSRPGTRPPGGVGEGRWPYPRMADPDRGREALRDSHARLLHTRWLRGR